MTKRQHKRKCPNVRAFLQPGQRPNPSWRTQQRSRSRQSLVRRVCDLRAVLVSACCRFYLDPIAWRQLRELALDLETSTQALGEEAVNLLFEKYRRNRSA